MTIFNPRRAVLTPFAIAITGGLSIGALSTGAQAAFIDDSTNALLLRNFYINRDFDDDASRSKAEEWTQSFIYNFKSGYTEGTVGFGLDVLAMTSIKLDGGGGTAGTQLLPVNNGQPADDFGRFAVAAKAKLSNTEARIGEWVVALPILRSDDGRSLPQTFRGAMVTSSELDGLTLHGGQMRQNSPRESASMDDMTLFGDANAWSDRFNFVGAEYQLTPQTRVGAWHARLEDVYQQSYLQLLHTQPFTENVALTANLGYFTGKDEGAARGGELDNRTWSGLFGLQSGGHTVYLGLQKVSGDTGWMRVNGTSGGTLANDSYNSSYDNANERSWQVRYDYNFTAMGVPGLTFMTRYISGDNVQNAATDDGKEWGRESELAYVFQSGAMKDLTLRWRQSSMRRDWNPNASFDEHRLIAQYPLNLF
ncbi:OprD family porin [Stutzerimonas tarimensis]|uniref:OprD family porin n=1 Tax=Stutzerimonas tarimensis TaxID=1507735 RepID=A0ABV7T3J9_9GAMM